MKIRALDRRSLAIALALGVATALAGCGKKEDPAAAAPAAPPAATSPEAAPAAAPAEAPAPVTAAEVTTTWTAEALEDLLAPVALYPDPVLSQVLIASTNPQEVLDAGNWLIANESLTGKALDDGAAKAGFTPPIRALVQFPQTIDMMCMEMGWTTELGQAFVADQAGVLAAVQRLRKQAIDVGNLKTSEAMIVETQTQADQEVVVLKPPKPEVIYVPTYDPQAAYAPPPATPAVATTTTAAPVEDKTKYSGSDMVMTGVLAFGAGILVNELFDDDDDDYHGYHYPNYGYGGMPYYPPYAYRPNYGNGYYPSNGYNRPPNYNNGGFQNNGNIYINTGNNDYWNRYDGRPQARTTGATAGGYAKTRDVRSPITKANPKRNDLNQLNQRAPRPMPANAQRPSTNVNASNWKGQSSYAGKDKRPANAQAGTRPMPTTMKDRPAPKVSGSYAGANKANRPSTGSMPNTRDMPNNMNTRDMPNTRDMQKPAQMQKPATRDLPKQKPATRDMPKQKPIPSGDRGYGGNTRDMQPKQRPSSQPMPMNRPTPSGGGMQGGNKANKGTAMSGAGGSRQSANAASQRGKQSMPQGARSKGGGGGGGKKKQAR